MGIQTDRDREAVKREFEKLTGPVKVIVSSQELGSETCQQTEWLVKEGVELTDKASGEGLNLILDRGKAGAYGVDPGPPPARRPSPRRPAPRSGASRRRSTSRSSRPRPDPTAPGPCAWLSTWRWRRTRSAPTPSSPTIFPQRASRIGSPRNPN